MIFFLSVKQNTTKENKKITKKKLYNTSLCLYIYDVILVVLLSHGTGMNQPIGCESSLLASTLTSVRV